MTFGDLITNINKLRIELTLINQDILYLSRHRNKICLDKNISDEFKLPILEIIDKYINAHYCKGKDLEKEIVRLEGSCTK